jgi:hydroxymethylpyrimidine pyrophosphatase-like HAD family hydrolase
MLIEIFDLDGTLTEEFSPVIGDKTGFGLTTYSLWNLITRELVKSKKEFDEAAENWKKHVIATKNIDKIAASKEMTEIGIGLLTKKNQNALAIRNKAAEITELFFNNGIIIATAIDYLKYRLREKVICVISTASYEEGAQGFIQGLVKCNLLNHDLADKIIVSGTKIDWHKLCVTHMNVDTYKLRGLEKTLQMDIKSIKPYIAAVFGDDPGINDRALLELGKYSFAIKNAKNQNAVLPPNCVFSNWNDIFAHKNNLQDLHSYNSNPMP